MPPLCLLHLVGVGGDVLGRGTGEGVLEVTWKSVTIKKKKKNQVSQAFAPFANMAARSLPAQSSGFAHRQARPTQRSVCGLQL